MQAIGNAKSVIYGIIMIIIFAISSCEFTSQQQAEQTNPINTAQLNQ